MAKIYLVRNSTTGSVIGIYKKLSLAGRHAEAEGGYVEERIINESEHFWVTEFHQTLENEEDA